eukprot:6187925-Pleurochrysis_carterae.AAC.2
MTVCTSKDMRVLCTVISAVGSETATCFALRTQSKLVMPSRRAQQCSSEGANKTYLFDASPPESNLHANTQRELPPSCRNGFGNLHIVR